MSSITAFAKIFASIGVIVALASPAGAQGVISKKTVSLAMAQDIANAALAQCSAMGYNISVTVLNRDGLPLVMLRGDGAALNTPEGSDRKAYTSLVFSAPSANFAERIHADPGYVGALQYSRVLAIDGGLPIKLGNEVIGAVGVSGSPGKDGVCSQAGIDKVAAQLK